MTTAGDIIDQALQRADMENTSFIGASERLAFLDNSHKELYDLIVSVYEDYNVTTEDTSVTTADHMTLPNDFYKIRGVDRKYGGRYRPIEQFDFSDRHGADAGEVAGDYRLWYIPIPSDITATGDTIEEYNGWDEYLVVDLARKFLDKEESDSRLMMAEKAALRNRILGMAKNRNASGAGVIEDVTREYRYTPCIKYRLIGSKIYLQAEEWYGGWE